jgi:hypothetical protein
MKSEFPIFLAAALLLGSSGAEAATNRNIILAPPTDQLDPTSDQSDRRHFARWGFRLSSDQTNPNEGVGSIQNFGALPGEPGSPTYNPNAALPPLNNPAGTGTSGGTSSGM